MFRRIKKTLKKKPARKKIKSTNYKTNTNYDHDYESFNNDSCDYGNYDTESCESDFGGCDSCDCE